MEAFKFFLSEFWIPFGGIIVLAFIFWFVRRPASGGCPPFIGARSFKELSDLPKEEQKGVLREASREAFSGVATMALIVVFSAVFASGIAFGRILPSVFPVPTSLWVTVVTAALFAGLAVLVSGWLGKRRVRPYLKRCLEKPAQPPVARPQSRSEVA